MDYAKLLFAFAVRELTVARLGFQSEGMSEAEKNAYRDANNQRIINEVIEEIQFVAEVIEKTIAKSTDRGAGPTLTETPAPHH